LFLFSLGCRKLSLPYLGVDLGVVRQRLRLKEESMIAVRRRAFDGIGR
jgi:hypothetical protein